MESKNRAMTYAGVLCQNAMRILSQIDRKWAENDTGHVSDRKRATNTQTNGSVMKKGV
jgi:hypothetical protein